MHLKLLTITTAAALLAIPGALQADIITFGNLLGPNNKAYGGSIEGPWIISIQSLGWFQGLIYGNSAPSIYAGPIRAPSNSTIQIIDSFPPTPLFAFASLDYSSNNGTGSRYDIRGFRRNTMVFDLSGSLSPSLPPSFGFTTLLSGNSTLVDGLTIKVLPGRGTTSINLDNIVLNSHQVPDGGATVMLLGAALGVLGVARRYLFA